jgi:uncharacterized membrane protein YkoI
MVTPFLKVDKWRKIYHNKIMNRKIFKLLLIGTLTFIIFANFNYQIIAEEKMPMAPASETSSQSKIEINPQSDNPVLINKEPLNTNQSGTGKQPVISVIPQQPDNNGNQTNKLPLDSSTSVTKQPLQIEVNKETKEAIIEQGDTTVRTKEPITIENNQLNIQTNEGKMPINVLPDKITKMAIQNEPQEINDISLKTIDKQPIYEVNGVKEEKVLNIIPVKMPIKTEVSARTGEIVKVEKPWWAKLLDPISF